VSRPGKVIGRVVAVVLGAVVGTGIVFAVNGLTSEDLESTTSDEELIESADEVGRKPKAGGKETSGGKSQSGGAVEQPRVGADVMLAWAPGSLPAGTEERIEAMPEVVDATTVYAGLDWIHEARDPQGRLIERHVGGFAVPFEIASIEPREYARFVPEEDRERVESLDRAGALLAETSTELRKGGTGLTLELESSDLRVTGVVSDLGTNGYEALVASPPPEHWERADRFVLAHLRKPEDRAAVAQEIESMLPPGEPLRARSEGENPFLRYGDAVLPQLLVKDTFGEFAARDFGNGGIQIGAGWVRRNITTDGVPILGQVTCHRLLFPQLKEALRDVKREGLSHTIVESNGCYAPRFINSNPAGRLSHHSWGIAIDMNSSDNSFGAKPNMDMRVVDVFEDRWGFTWGGRWIIPDGMHYEWIKFP
jgi:D-alanyl-D-alanine carboxypeptidase